MSLCWFHVIYSTIGKFMYMKVFVCVFFYKSKKSRLLICELSVFHFKFAISFVNILKIIRCGPLSMPLYVMAWHVQYTNHTNYMVSMLFDKFANNNQLHGFVHNLNIFELLNASHCDARPTVMYCTTILAKCYFILFSMIGISDTW